MPSINPHPDDHCCVCGGDGEIEICMSCANEIDNCECEGGASDSEMATCPECDGTGDADNDVKEST